MERNVVPVFRTLLFIIILNHKLYAQEAEEYIVNTEESRIEWTGTKPDGKHKGMVSLSSGVVSYKNGQITGGVFTINFNSIVNFDQKTVLWNTTLVDHLKSDEFFYVQKYPEGTFRITRAEIKPNNNYLITGNLSIQSVTQSISFDALIKKSENKITVTTQVFSIDRTKWNINTMSRSVFDNLKNDYIDDEIMIRVILVAECNQDE